MANLQSQIDILAKAVVNEHVKTENLKLTRKARVFKPKIYNGDSIFEQLEDKPPITYTEEIYDIQLNNTSVGKLYGHSNEKTSKSQLFGGFLAHDENVLTII